MDPKQPDIPPPLTPQPDERAAAAYGKQHIGQNTSHVTSGPSDADGHNYHPEIRRTYANEPKVVHTSRDPSQEPFPLSDEVRQKSEESKRRYPMLNLSHGEFVILDIQRHPIGLVLPLASGGVMLLAFIITLIIYPTNATSLGLPSFLLATFIGSLLMLLVGIGTYIAVWVYQQNRFFLTNESVIQEIQNALFSRHVQMVSLGSIEDASYKQHGLLQSTLNYGTIRLSTEGDETTYRFSYVADPNKQVAVLNDAIEAFKNGRPYDSKDDVN